MIKQKITSSRLWYQLSYYKFLNVSDVVILDFLRIRDTGFVNA